MQRHFGVPRGVGRKQMLLKLCKTPGCVSPDCWTVTDQRGLSQDNAKKGKCGFARLRPDEIPEIRELLAAGEGQRDIAKAFGVSQATISRINTNNAWGYV